MEFWVDFYRIFIELSAILKEGTVNHGYGLTAAFVVVPGYFLSRWWQLFSDSFQRYLK